MKKFLLLAALALPLLFSTGCKDKPKPEEYFMRSWSMQLDLKEYGIYKMVLDLKSDYSLVLTESIRNGRDYEEDVVTGSWTPAVDEMRVVATIKKANGELVSAHFKKYGERYLYWEEEDLYFE